MSDVSPPLKWHGGKGYLAQRIIELMPPRVVNGNSPAEDDPGWLHYVEPYAGGLSVLLANDSEGVSEVANDINYWLTNFWSVLKDEDTFIRFQRILDATPFGQLQFEKALDNFKVETLDARDCRAAVDFFIACRQSMSGRMDSFAPLTRNRTRRGMNEQASAWLNCIEGLPMVHARLKRVVILNKPALEVIKQQDGPRSLFYLDPPYLHETRATTGEYAHEMDEVDHIELLDVLSTIKGRFLLSGYPSRLYDDSAKEFGWRQVDFDLPNNSSSAKTKQRKTERVWMNYEATR